MTKRNSLGGGADLALNMGHHSPPHAGRVRTRRRDKPLSWWLIKFGPILAILAFYAAHTHFNPEGGAPLPKYSSRALLGDDDDDGPDCDVEPANFPGGACAYYDAGCGESESLINYQKIVTCDVTGPWLYAVYVGLVAWMFVLFYVLGDTADVYFSPALMSISELLHMSPSLAGVTFLALGNGAPDVFSQTAALLNGDNALGLANTLGGGTFVTTVVMGAVCISNTRRINRRPFIRDVVFYVVVVFGLMGICVDGYVKLWEAVLFLGYYFCYVMFVVGSRVVYQCSKRKSRHERGNSAYAHEPLVEAMSVTDGVVEVEEEDASEDEFDYHPMKDIINMKHKMAFQHHHHHMHRNRSNSAPLDLIGQLNMDAEFLQKNNKDITTNARVRSISDTVIAAGAYVEFDDNLTWEARKEMIEAKKNHRESEGTAGALKEMFNDMVSDFLDRGCFSKCFFVLEIPMRVVRNLTIPAMEEDDWNRIWAVLNPTGSIAFAGLALGFWADHWLILGIATACGAVVSLVVLFASSWSKPPWGYSILSLLAFAMSVIWIYLTANELVAVLDVIGLALKIPKSVLGVTVLAWGNSLGDLIADVAISKAGEPAMAVAGVYAGPLFNCLVGMGVPLLIVTIRDGDFLIVNKTQEGVTLYYAVSFGMLLLGLFTALVLVPLKKFTPDKWVGYVLLAIYAVFLPCNVAMSMYYQIGVDN